MNAELKDDYQERIENCHIHKSLDIDNYLKESGVPADLWHLFHEIVLARGQFPINMDTKERALFDITVESQIKKYNLSAYQTIALRGLFRHLEQYWKNQQSDN